MVDLPYRSHCEGRFLKRMIPVMAVSMVTYCVLISSLPRPFLKTRPPLAENYMTASSTNISTSVGTGETKELDSRVYRHYLQDRTSWKTMSQVADVQKTTTQLTKSTANLKIGDNVQAGESLTQDGRFNRYDLHNHTSWTNLRQITDAKRTTIRLMKLKDKLKVGDQIQVRIVARDEMGNTKAYGGDAIRIKLSSDGTRSYVNPDYIIDNGNGTYDAYFTLRWPGRTHIDAMLVHPSEAVRVIDRLIQNMPNRLAYDARYTDPKTNQEEVTTCDVVVPSQKEYCNYSDPRVFAPWYCEKPTTPGIKCNNIPAVCTNEARARKIVNENTTPLEMEAIERLKIPIGNRPVPIHVSDEKSAFQEPPQLCQLTKIPTDMSAQGYFLNDTWHPFRCKIKNFSVKETLTCLKGKRVYMFGDSTIRQFKEYFQRSFEGFKHISETKGRFPLSPKHLYNSVYNITIKYRSHGLPLKSPCQPMTEINYVFNELNKLQGGPDVVVLISLWAHFGKTTLYFYQKRIEAILDSIQRLLERFPETTVIFKGANTRKNADSFWAICSSDWVAYRFEEKLRSILSRRNLNIGFLDAWDLTTAHYSVDCTHPNNHIVRTMVNQVLTHYCK